MTRWSYAAVALFALSAIGAHANDCRSSGSVPALSTYCKTDPPMGCKAYCSGPHAIAFTLACAEGGGRTYEFQEAIESRLILATEQGIAPPAHGHARSVGARPRTMVPDEAAEPRPPTEERWLLHMGHAVIIQMPRNEELALLDSLDEAVIVEHTDGTRGVYAPEDWPDDGPGKIIGRKRLDGKIGWYAGPDAGPRSDPNAFIPTEVPEVWRAADGTVMLGDEPADDCIFGGKCAH